METSPRELVDDCRYAEKLAIRDMTNNSNDHWLESLREELNEYGENLWDNLHQVPQLNTHASSAIISRFLVMACQCQHARNIVLGRMGIGSLPRDWLLQRIEKIADETLNLTEPWEYLRLLEVYNELDDALHSQGSSSGKRKTPLTSNANFLPAADVRLLLLLRDAPKDGCFSPIAVCRSVYLRFACSDGVLFSSNAVVVNAHQWKGLRHSGGLGSSRSRFLAK